MVWPGPVYFPEMLWDEAEHPRHPRGTSRGGQFREKTGDPASGASENWIQTAIHGVGLDLGEDDLREVIAQGREIARTPLTGGSIGTTSIVTLEMPDGLRVAVVHKRQDPEYSDLEVWSSRIGRAIGAPVPAVVYDPGDEDSVYLSYVEGHSGVERATAMADDFADNEYSIMDTLIEQYSATRRGALLGLLDVALLNRDRHGGNWMIDTEDQVWGIDHTHIGPWDSGDYDVSYEDFGAAVHQGSSALTIDDIAEAKVRIGDLVDNNRIPTEWWPTISDRLDRLQRSYELVSSYSFPGGAY